MTETGVQSFLQWAGDLPAVELYGVPLQSLLHVGLMFFLCVTAADKGGRLACRVFRSLFRKKSQADFPPETHYPGCCPEGPPLEECEGLTDAALAALDCMSEGRPYYDHISRVLHCPGLAVAFSQGDAPSVLSVHAGASPGKDGKIDLGEDVCHLFSDFDRRIVYGHATDLRTEVLRRDKADANREAGRRMARVRYETVATDPDVDPLALRLYDVPRTANPAARAFVPPGKRKP